MKVRKYARSSHIISNLEIHDGIRWHKATLSNISAGGLCFLSKDDYGVGANVKMSLSVYSQLSEFRMELEGTVLRAVEAEGQQSEYNVKFVGLSDYLRVQIDELIKNEGSLHRDVSYDNYE
ncbi:MAG: PilZ domain-containing protein [Oscillospiraceae bacterium]|nr:PilZ domain-containing protein [Oscillospiraceae bacterium]